MAKSVYVHIPFCKQKCLYCDFNSFQNKENLIEKYMEALYKECAKFSFNELETIYIGGGTPSFIDSKYIVKLLSMLPKAKEITIEMNPCTVTVEKLQDYKRAGINRISMGLQTTNENILKKIGRVHNLADFQNAYKMISDVGFENINVDLMFGLPSQKLEDVKESLEYLINLNPKHISCYSLIVHNDIFENLPTDEEEREMYYYVKSKLKENGYNQYEISNFSKKGYESKHNVMCWMQEEYLGLGAGASSYVDSTRYTNEPRIEEYIRKIENNEDIRNIEEVQDEKAKISEKIILGLRLTRGICLSDFSEIERDYLENGENKKIDTLIKKGLLEKYVDNDKIWLKLTEKGMDLANLVWEEFI